MMRSWHVADLTAPLDATLHGANAAVDSVAIDSRDVVPGSLFVAFAGAHHDGHDFLSEVADRGAAAAVVERLQPVPLPQLQVADCLRALGALGAENRRLFQGPVAAVTGSAGKTTCKEMLAAILGQAGAVLATRGNRNNEIGLPLTLLDLKPQHHYAVLEMGAARAGDIEYLCRFARPDLALVTNAMAAHLEGFGDVDTVAATKGEIYAGVASGGIAVIDLDSPFHTLWRGLAGNARVVSFSVDNPAADVFARRIESRGVEGLRFDLSLRGLVEPIGVQLLGRHNVANACAAAAAALALGMPPESIAAGLARPRPVPGRLAPVRLGSGRWLIDDSYNANPGAVRAAIDVLAECDGHRALLLGDMVELGPDSEAYHREAGAYAARCGIETLWSVGRFAAETAAGFGGGARSFSDQSALRAELGALQADVILIKGSRSAVMEHVVADLAGGPVAGGAP